jgi:hypothetical protein
VGLGLFLGYLAISLAGLVADSPGRLADRTRDEFRAGADPVAVLIERAGQAVRPVHAAGGSTDPGAGR